MSAAGWALVGAGDPIDRDDTDTVAHWWVAPHGAICGAEDFGLAYEDSTETPRCARCATRREEQLLGTTADLEARLAQVQDAAWLIEVLNQASTSLAAALKEKNE